MKSTLQTINDLAEKSPKELVMRAERHYLNEISAAADRIAQNKSIKVIAIAGPSSSGKTTTAHMLREALAKQGIKTDVVSLDDFYLPQETLPLLPDGTPWSIVQRTPAPDGSGTENENEWDNSAYSLSGDITDHRDGTVTIKMGKPTDLEDAYEMLLGGDEA